MVNNKKKTEIKRQNKSNTKRSKPNTNTSKSSTNTRKSNKSRKSITKTKNNQSGGKLINDNIDILDGHNELRMDKLLQSEGVRPFPDNCVIM